MPSARTQNALSVALAALGIAVSILFPTLWPLGVLCGGLAVGGVVYTWLSHAEDRREDESRARLRHEAREIIVGLIEEGKRLHNEPGYYPDSSSSTLIALTVRPATPSAEIGSHHADFVAKVEHEWRVAFSEKLNAWPFKKGTGGVFLDDQGNRLDQALARLQDMLHHLDAHIDFERCG